MPVPTITPLRHPVFGQYHLEISRNCTILFNMLSQCRPNLPIEVAHLRALDRETPRPDAATGRVLPAIPRTATRARHGSTSGCLRETRAEWLGSKWPRAANPARANRGSGGVDTSYRPRRDLLLDDEQKTRCRLHRLCREGWGTPPKSCNLLQSAAIDVKGRAGIAGGEATENGGVVQAGFSDVQHVNNKEGRKPGRARSCRLLPSCLHQIVFTAFG